MISDIKGFLFGGFDSRFWAMRKHINAMSRKELKNLQFYSWECITLEKGVRNINLVIKDQMQMDLFLKFLIYRLETVDGNVGSGKKLVEYRAPIELERLRVMLDVPELTPV